ncbi:MAG: tRNA-dihydrouridine synthase family protein [Bacteroidaceae bacterium]|nr:tRNA-dihydrouridine synthase family protein [Bacteroidaceae bacterium]
MKIYSAPLQGFTEAVWRNVHNEVFGGIDDYYTPFLRYEHSEIRSKDIRDVERRNNAVENLVPQIIAATPEEMRPLLELIRNEGYKRVDINMGCSFPLQARKKHGAGILPHSDLVAGILEEVKRNDDIVFSIKMRLGWNDKHEWQALMEMINDTPLSHVTMHPRLGVEQYKKPVDIDAFREFYDACKHPVVYNGDLLTLQDIQRVENEFPELDGIMLGRGLLANPALGLEYSAGKEMSNKELAISVRKMHDKMHDVMAQRLQGNTQYLNKLKPYWEYLLPDMQKRDKKAILKAATIEKYMYAVNDGLANY